VTIVELSTSAPFVVLAEGGSTFNGVVRQVSR